MNTRDTAHEGGAEPGFFKRTVLNFRAQIDFAKSHWLASVIYFIAVAIGAWELGGRYEQWRWGSTTDERLLEIREEQAAAFKNLDDKLGELRGAVDGDGRDVLREVSNVVEEIKATNNGLLHQLALAGDENKRLSQVGGAQAGVSGGYDFILSEHTGMRVDDTTVVGVGNIDRSGATVTVTANDANGRGRFLSSGEAVAFRNASGESCRVVLLSVTANAAASFDVACGVG